MTISRFNMSIGGRKLQLLFDLEDEFYSDVALNYLLSRGMLPEPEVLHALSHLIQPGDCVVDAGANVGFFTVVMSKLVGKQDGCVIAIEPDLRNAKKLRKNLDINDCQNVVVYETALGAFAEKRKLFTRTENGCSSLHDGCVIGDFLDVQETETVPLKLLLGKQRPAFMKLDVEGSELEVIRGCDVKIPFVIAEMNDEALVRAGTSAEKFRFHFENIWGHRTHILPETGGMPAILAVAPSQKIVSGKPNANILFASEWDVIRAWPEVRI